MTVPYEMDEINEELTDNYNLEYNDTIEQLIKSKGEQCEILSKLHLMSHEEYKRKELFFNIPIITVTAIVGFVSALKIDYEYMNIVIGGCSLLVSLMQSYLSFFKISQKNENHRVAYLQYFQISNEMRIEMSLTPAMSSYSPICTSLASVNTNRYLTPSDNHMSSGSLPPESRMMGLAFVSTPITDV